MKFITITTLLTVLTGSFVFSQKKLPQYDKEKITGQTDWLIEQVNTKTDLYENESGQLVLSNGIVSRTFSVKPDGATIGLDLLSSNESFMRSVRPEAEVVIDGIKLNVGGLTGQPIHNYLLPEWIENMESDPSSFHLTGFRLEETKERFSWKKRLEWMPKDLPWPAPGKELIFSYQLDNNAIRTLVETNMSDENRTVIFRDGFKNLNEKWKLYESNAGDRNSFINEGKAGEIMALTNASVFAEIRFLKGTQVIIAKVNPGTDLAASFGPGIALVFDDRNIKINVRPQQNQFGFFDGKDEQVVSGMEPGKAVWLRLEIKNDDVLASWSYDKVSWTTVGSAKIQDGKTPVSVRVGKMDRIGENSDNRNKGEWGRCRIEEFAMLGHFPENTKSLALGNLQYLKNIVVKVHYELYDGMPVFCKWLTIENNSGRAVTINKFKSEILAATEPESTVDNREHWNYPNITVETDYNFGGMTSENILRSSVAWDVDPLYKTQVNYERVMPCLLEVYPKYGPEAEVKPNETFSTYRVWETLHDSWDRERKGLEHRKMMRAMAPWVTENPILMHVRSAENDAVKKAVDQCAEVGFEKVIMTFGSGFNAEDSSLENLERMKMLAEYAHSKGITLGGYSLLASRRIDDKNDVVMPEGMKPRFGNSPCIESEWGHNYFAKLYKLYENTGLDNFEHDGSYPGDVCASTEHPGHKGLQDSQWKQYKTITDFYKWCRSKGIYLNVPDYYFLSGSNKTGMGYRETNWSLPREQQEIVERQNIFDGTWEKTPSMGWMFVPLVEYQGGGAAATIEPLKEHLQHYGQRLANLFGAGVQACYRGPQLYDAPETEALVKKWVDFYKKYRRILDGDIIHIRRPDGKDYDAILHVDPANDIKGMLVIYNPLNEPIKRKIKVNLYYTGLKDVAKVSCEERPENTIEISRDYNAWFETEIPARGQTWFTVR